ncbi:MAG: glycerol-3-phosphate 1-O-acyltransferase PlsY [Chitinophagales bacterium]|nr:glycerol-3-phosphate 1-O-acyltransferase PlsY [Chitinophagales bacterium]
MNYEFIIAFVLAYLIGAIPFSVWTGLLFYGKDVRKYGSGNAGATNTFRVLGTQAGIIVLFLDIVKGSIAVSLAYYLGGIPFDSDNFIFYELALGITAAVGHIFPVYLRFKGGKGVATLFGVGISVFPVAALACVMVFIIIFLLTRYVSLGSILAAITFPVVIIFYGHVRQWPVLAFAIAIPCIILYTHRLNIRRLLKGEEHKIAFGKKQ